MRVAAILVAGAALVCVSTTGADAQLVTLWNELGGYNGNVMASNNFGPGNAFNSDVADDFVVPAGVTWHIRRVLVRGQYSSGGSAASSVNVFFYNDAGGQPGSLASQCLNLTGLGFAVGNFNVPLTVCTPVMPDLTGGTSGTHYWVEVQANITTPNSGFWLWDNRNTTLGYVPEFQNPGGGFGTGCTVWMSELLCGGGGTDHRFRLRGY
ncbi:MAG: hypothetical protein JO208_11305 [Alphaproteobacteria bacterium]|nr:hypothetical protein [Alphaproteobacteria bacterium]